MIAWNNVSHDWPLVSVDCQDSFQHVLMLRTQPLVLGNGPTTFEHAEDNPQGYGNLEMLATKYGRWFKRHFRQAIGRIVRLAVPSGRCGTS